MILMTISPWGLSKEYIGTFMAEMSSLPLALLVKGMMTVGLLLLMILTLKFLMTFLNFDEHDGSPQSGPRDDYFIKQRSCLIF